MSGSHSHWLRAIAILVTCGALIWLFPERSSAIDDRGVVPGRVIVKLRPGTLADSARNAAGVVTPVVAVQTGLGAQIWRVAPGTEREAAERLTAVPGVEYAEPDWRVRALFVPNDPLYPTNQWNLAEINAPAAWDVTTGASSVLLAVIDTGLDRTHPDTPEFVTLGCDYVRWGLLNYTGSCPIVDRDESGHGTHVAGTIAARQNNGLYMSGIAPGITVLVLRVLDDQGAGFASDVASAIEAAADAGARVINLSLGGPDQSIIQRSAIEYALSRGAIVVAAAGNDYLSGNSPNYPAAYPTVVAVGATTVDRLRASYSNTGAYVSLVAPGGSGSAVGRAITSLYPIGSGGVRHLSGTSHAAPHVASVATLMLSIRPDLTRADVVNVLRATARRLGSPVPNDSYGYGLVDAGAALVAARTYNVGATPTTTIAPTATLSAIASSTRSPPPTGGSTPTAFVSATVTPQSLPVAVTPTAISASPTATATPAHLIPVTSPTVAPVEIQNLPRGIPTVDASTGGAAWLVPTVPTSQAAVAVLSPAGAPFRLTLVVPAPASGEAAIGVRLQPGTTVPAEGLAPGVTTSNVVAIDVFDPTSGAIQHEHRRRLTLAVEVGAAEQALCRSSPGRVALLHLDAAGRVTRVPVVLDCDAATITASLATTSNFAVAALDRADLVPFRMLLPRVSRSTEGP